MNKEPILPSAQALIWLANQLPRTCLRKYITVFIFDKLEEKTLIIQLFSS